MNPKTSNLWKKQAAKLPVIGILALLACSMPCVADDAAQPVTYRTVGAEDYQSFIGNWDEKKDPVLCAVIQTPQNWDALFHPAAFGYGKNTQKKPFGPDAKIFEKEQLLVVARVMPSLPDGQWKEVFKVEEVSASGDVLTLRYRFEPKSGTAFTSRVAFTVKNFLGVIVPKHDYKKITFVENGKTVGELDLASGQWAVPTIGK